MIKKIWTYWNSDTLPELVDAAINSWKINAAEWKLTIINDSNLHKYINKNELPDNFDIIHDKRNIQFKSDLIRTLLLYKYGGLWLDASLFLLVNLDWLDDHVISNNIKGITGFIMPEFCGDKYMENWFIYVNNIKNKNIKKIYDLLVENCKYDKATDHYIYVPDFFSSSIYCSTSKSYFIWFQCYYYLFKTDIDFRKAHFDAKLIYTPSFTTKIRKVIRNIQLLKDLYSPKNNYELKSDNNIEPFISNDKLYKLDRHARRVYEYRNYILASILLFILLLCIFIVIIIYQFMKYN